MSNMRRRGLAAFAGLTFVICLAGCGGPAQIGTDEGVHNTVDALFTALTAKDIRLLDQCEQKLAEHKAAGKLPADSSATLKKVIAQARGGDWESAAKRLYKFIDGQRSGPGG